MIGYVSHLGQLALEGDLCSVHSLLLKKHEDRVEVSGCPKPGGSACWGSAWRIWRQEGHRETGVVFFLSPFFFFSFPHPLPWLEVAGKAEPLHCYHRIYIA